MCGISVSIRLDRRQTGRATGAACQQETRTKLETQLSKSLDLIAHRGPDAKGIWINDDASVGLAHNRLSINDLTPSGTQPHHSSDGNLHAVVNGEIYDEGDALRTRLATEHGYAFHSHADTELVLALYSAYGAPAFLDHLRGEFSLVLYDDRDGGRVIAARDRFGIKPLFWTIIKDEEDGEEGGGGGGGERLLIAAEAKAFLALGWQPEWDVGAIVEGVWQVGERTLFKGVQKVLPACWMEVGRNGNMVQRRYWDMEYRDKREREVRSVEEMVLGVREKLTEAIRLRLRADVPVGIYLSGGIDSSLLAGIVTHLVRDDGIRIGNRDATSRICCFSIEFPSEGHFDESEIAERTANHLGVQILKKRMDEATLAENFADSAYHCEHHNFDLNSVGKFCLSTVPRENGFKVVLTGEGSDEHFTGYPFFVPDFLREPDLAMPDTELSKNSELRERLQDKARKDFDILLRAGAGFFQHGSDFGETFRAVNDVSVMGWAAVFQPSLHLFAPWVREKCAGVNVALAEINEMPAEAKEKIRDKWHPLHSSQYLWSRSMLANNLLTCLGDRTEMAHSIEARPPFLDHVLSEYLNALPPSVKLAYTPQMQDSDRSGGLPWAGTREKFITDLFTEKWILREAGKPYITKELYERKKQPYVAPNRWPKDGPLHNKLREICTREAVEQLGFVDWEIVRRALDTAFGEGADGASFRVLLVVGAWVTLSERFGIKRAEL
ncbi:asparagine synthase [Chaetomium strumarium]|uniref:Asparagine synthase n=1 Tax=Chaetomium strumarium TaxID=1170767 RepID=A0AAJ0M6N4_9PEZI|nr:asparagine synthase [Chaetomium strumarium]